ncbi:MAG: hypothetical protein D3917_11635 [Candidatus Electrothrix sp. AX5]|nr:hypothetical protein [Candidatus Electrothrix sp. AX5]
MYEGFLVLVHFFRYAMVELSPRLIADNFLRRGFFMTKPKLLSFRVILSIRGVLYGLFQKSKAK